MKRILVSLALTMPFVACGGSTTEGRLDPGGPVVEYPEWVNKGSGAFGGETKVFYGVGSASGIKNTSLLRSTSENRARSEIGKTFEVYTASLMKDFQQSITAGDFSASSEEQLVSNAVKTFSAQTLNGVQIVDHWIHPVSGEMFALARLDIAGFADQLEKAKELSEKVKEQVKKSAAKAFADLEAEEAKRADQ
ncbi:MAG: LPP20 family lipoprotein [Deltaproteobacteria bacterium]|nr:LPP20 family lipoprotein [Deltaproteobacteria bacterium]